MIAEGSVPRRSERIASRVLEGQALIVVIDDQQLHMLNEVGARVWELCDGRTVSEIVGTIVEEFEVSAQQASSDVQRFLAELQRVGALQTEASDE